MVIHYEDNLVTLKITKKILIALLSLVYCVSGDLKFKIFSLMFWAIPLPKLPSTKQNS